jgi:hypothetical protein
LFGCLVVWLCCLVVLFGCVVWLCCLVVLFGCVVWFGCLVVWLCVLVWLFGCLVVCFVCLLCFFGPALACFALRARSCECATPPAMRFSLQQRSQWNAQPLIKQPTPRTTQRAAHAPARDAVELQESTRARARTHAHADKHAREPGLELRRRSSVRCSSKSATSSRAISAGSGNRRPQSPPCAQKRSHARARTRTHTQKRTRTRAGGKGAHKWETRTRVRTLTGRSEVAWLWRVLADGRSGLRGFRRGGGGVRMHTCPREL